MTRHDVISLVYANDELRIIILLFEHLSKAINKSIRKYILKLLNLIHANEVLHLNIIKLSLLYFDKLNCE